MPHAELDAALTSTTHAALALALLAVPARAGEADVVAARAEALGGGAWRVSATVRHADEGWQHYADAFDVLGPDGAVLATRTLHHPHVDEQPFTRSVTVEVLDGVRAVTVRARDSVHEFGGVTVEVALPDASSPGPQELPDAQ